MVVVLFYVKYDKESQMAYKELMNSPIEFKTFEIRGKNVAERLSSLGITKVPTLVITSKKQKYQGYMDIKKLIDKIEKQSENVKKILQEKRKDQKESEPEESKEDHKSEDIENSEPDESKHEESDPEESDPEESEPEESEQEIEI
jgi:hypothetical protein